MWIGFSSSTLAHEWISRIGGADGRGMVVGAGGAHVAAAHILVEVEISRLGAALN